MTSPKDCTRGTQSIMETDCYCDKCLEKLSRLANPQRLNDHKTECTCQECLIYLRNELLMLEIPSDLKERAVLMVDLVKKRIEQSKKLEQKRNCLDCGQLCGEDYAVTNEIWAQAGLKPYDGRLHLRCLAQRLGRTITRADFTDASINGAIFYTLNTGL